MPSLDVLDTEVVVLGTTNKYALRKSLADANAEMAIVDLPVGGAVAVPVLAVGVRLDGKDLGVFDGLTQPMMPLIDLDYDSYVGFHFSADDVAVVRMRLNAGTVRNHTIPDIASDTFTMNAATQTLSAKTLASPTITGVASFADGTEAAPSVTFTTDPDNGLYLAAANNWHIIVGGATALAFTASISVFNEDGDDRDWRLESDTNASIIVMDAGQYTGVGALGIGRAVNTVTSLLIGFPALTGVANSNYYVVDISNSGSVTIPTGTSALVGTLNLEEPDITATGTASDAFTLRIGAAPTEGTRNYAFWVDAGVSRFDGTAQLGLAGSTLGVLTFNGNTSGTITVQSAAAAGTWTWTLPPDDGDAGEQLQTDGGGVTTWETAASYREAKDIIGILDPDTALDRILGTRPYLFRYKDGWRGVGRDYKTLFAGVVADEAPWVMQHNGRTFSQISAFGYTVASLQALDKRIETHEQRIVALEAENNELRRLIEAKEG